MGSVIDYIECPNCKTEAFSDFYYKTGEEYIHCSNCGYHKSVTIINRDKRLGELVDSDWKMYELKNPYGAYRLKYYDGVSTQCGSLESVDEFNELKQHVEKLDGIEYFSISRLVDGEIVVTHIIDKGPKVDGAGFSMDDREFESDDLPF
jgi:Zn ribbon nucleic-acid-binding protein